MSYGLPPSSGRHHFRLLMSFKMALSSIVSARSFRSDAAERRALECGAAQRRRLHDGCGSAWMSDRYTSVCTPAAHSLRVLHTHELRPPAEQRASPLSVVDVLQDGIVEHSLSEKLPIGRR